MAGELIEHGKDINIKDSVKISTEGLQLLKDKFEKIPTATGYLQNKIKEWNSSLPQNGAIGDAASFSKSEIERVKTEIKEYNLLASDPIKNLKFLGEKILPKDILKGNDIVIINGKVTLVPKAPETPKQQGSYNKDTSSATDDKIREAAALQKSKEFAEKVETTPTPTTKVVDASIRGAVTGGFKNTLDERNRNFSNVGK